MTSTYEKINNLSLLCKTSCHDGNSLLFDNMAVEADNMAFERINLAIASHNMSFVSIIMALEQESSENVTLAAIKLNYS